MLFLFWWVIGGEKVPFHQFWRSNLRGTKYLERGHHSPFHLTQEQSKKYNFYIMTLFLNKFAKETSVMYTWFSNGVGSANVWGSDFLGAARNFSIWQSPKMSGNWTKIFIKINRNIKDYQKIPEKPQSFESFLIIWRGIIFNCWKKNDYNMVWL